jgi:hypothetical protein
MKVTTSLENIKSFGGLNFVISEFDTLEFPKLITDSLGKRSISCQYEFSDMIKSLWSIFFAGADCAEDLQNHLNADFQMIDNLNFPSADTVLRLQKDLATKKEFHLSKNNIVNEINRHEKLNELNINLLLKTNQLKKSHFYDLDFDNQLIACEKYDAKKSYKMKNGYFPGVASIGRNIVYFENRNGNSNVKFKQNETLENTFKLLNNSEIKIDRARMDCGSFTQEVIEIVEKNCKKFYIRAQKCADLSTQIKQIANWEKVRIGDKLVEIASMEYKPFKKEKSYRYVIQRETNKTGQTTIETGDNFIYRAIITNDLLLDSKGVIEYYNQRGASEKIFDEMNNDFGWNNLPFSFLEENTVFMILMAMCRNFYLYLVDKFAKKLNFIENTFRLKKFIFRFVVVPFKWVKIGGQKTLKLFTDKDYSPILN